MTFLYPLGLLGLIGVPILIIIYIIKNKYTEQTVASTYIWTLSERFLKNKNPITRIYNILSLILQILAVICISVSTAHPVFALQGTANDYCFVLDCSVSMNFEQDGSTRFERGKTQIKDIVLQSGNGSSYTLICAGDSAVVAYKELTDKDRALELLDETVADSFTSDAESALAEAQKIFDETTAPSVYFMTDKSFRSVSNVTVCNLAYSEENCAVLSANAVFTEQGLEIYGKAISYGKNKNLTVSAYLDENSVAAAIANVEVAGINGAVAIPDEKEELSEELISLATDFSIVCEGVTEYRSIRISINSDDGFPSDDEIIKYNVKRDSSFSALIVSEGPFFIKSAVSALGYGDAYVITPKEYENNARSLSYGLYIFNGYTPERMPESGAVWFFSPTNVDSSGFSYQSDAGDDAKRLLSYSESSASTVRKLLSGVDKNEEIALSNYSKYSLNGEFVSLLYCEGNPVLFAGSNEYGNREVVFAFSLNDSDIVLGFNWLQLTSNLLEYTFPSIIDKSDYFCGDTADINVVANCVSIRVTSPSGTDEELDTETAVTQYKLNETGLYAVTVKTGGLNAAERTVYIYAQTPYEEGVPVAEGSSFEVTGEAVSLTKDGFYDDILGLFIIIAALFVADWGVYCYEQYQLR